MGLHSENIALYSTVVVVSSSTCQRALSLATGNERGIASIFGTGSHCVAQQLHVYIRPDFGWLDLRGVMVWTVRQPRRTAPRQLAGDQHLTQSTLECCAPGGGRGQRGCQGSTPRGAGCASRSMSRGSGVLRGDGGWSGWMASEAVVIRGQLLMLLTGDDPG